MNPQLDFEKAVAAAVVGHWDELADLLELNSSIASMVDTAGRSLLLVISGLDGASGVLDAVIRSNPHAVSMPDDSGATPLGNAIHGGHRLGIGTDANVWALVDFGADLELFDETGNPPLHAAIYERRWNVVEHLLVHGAKATQLNAYGDDAYRYAEYVGAAEAFNYLPSRA